jgi:hypothetical protein
MLGGDIIIRESEDNAWEQFKIEQGRKEVDLASVAFGAESQFETYPERKRRAVTIVTPERNTQIQKQNKTARASSADGWAAKHVHVAYLNSLE